MGVFLDLFAPRPKILEGFSTIDCKHKENSWYSFVEGLHKRPEKFLSSLKLHKSYRIPNLQADLFARLRRDNFSRVLNPNSDIIVIHELSFYISGYKRRLSHSFLAKGLPWCPTTMILKFKISGTSSIYIIVWVYNQITPFLSKRFLMQYICTIAVPRITTASKAVNFSISYS